MVEAHDLDTLMGHMGDFGKYQAWQFTLHILSAVIAGLNMLQLVTVAAIPEHRCEIPGESGLSFRNESLITDYIPLLPNGNMDNCQLFNITTNETYKCDSWIYDDTYYKTSRAIDWNFVCDRRWMGAVAQSMYMFGVFTGAVTLGTMADKYGRKPVFCWSALLQLILGVGVAFSPNYYSFIIIRYIYGIFGSAGSYIPGFVLTMELVGPSKRSICGMSFQAAFAFGIMLVAAWGSFVKDRFTLQIIYGLHALVLIGHFWLMDESPRWLWANGKKKQSIDIIKKALQTNNSPVNLNSDVILSKTQSQDKLEPPTEEAGMMDLFKTPRLRKMTLNVCLAWFANSIVYYGLSLSTGSLKGNPYLILLVMGLVEMPSYAISIYAMDKLGRRPITSFNMILGGICCMLAANLTMGSPPSTFFVFVGKFLIASSFAVIYNYSAELFPTVIRNSAMGLGSMCARTSGALTPLIILFDSFSPSLPSTIFAVIALVSGFLTLFLPETLNKAMPQTIEDGENFGIGDTCFTSCMGSKKEDSTSTPHELQPLKK